MADVAHFLLDEHKDPLDASLDEIEAHDLFHKMAEISHGETSRLFH